MPPAINGQRPPWRSQPARGGPDHQMRRTGGNHLLATGAPVRLARTLTRHAPDQEVPVPGAVRFLAAERCEPTIGGFCPADPAPTRGTVPTHGSMGATGHPTTVTPAAPSPDDAGSVSGSVELNHRQDVSGRI